MRLTLERKENNIRCQSNRRRGRQVYLYLFFLLVCLVFTGCGEREITVPVYDEEPEAVDEISAFVIVSNIDEVNGKISLKTVSYDTELILSYNGGTDVQDKYGDVLSMSRVEPGTVADIVYDGNRDKLISLHVSKNEKVQKMEHISGAKVDILENTPKKSDGGKKMRLVNLMIDFLKQNLNEPLNLSELANQLSISKHFLCHIFEKKTGYEINKYRDICRMTKAKELLITTTLTVSDICKECGFETERMFVDEFMQSQGITPEEYRKYNKKRT